MNRMNILVGIFFALEVQHMRRARRFTRTRSKYRHVPLQGRNCSSCERHGAVFHRRGRVKADASHDLCPRCYRAARNRSRPREPLFSRGGRGGGTVHEDR